MRNQEARLRGKIQKVLVMMPNFIFESLDPAKKQKVDVSWRYGASRDSH